MIKKIEDGSGKIAIFKLIQNDEHCKERFDKTACEEEKIWMKDVSELF